MLKSQQLKNTQSFLVHVTFPLPLAQGISSPWHSGAQVHRGHSMLELHYLEYAASLLMGQKKQLQDHMSPLKLCSLEVNASLLTTVQWLALAMWPHLTPGWAMCWHELDVSVCLSPLSFLAPTQPCPAFPPPSLWLSVYTDCLLGVRGKSPRLLFQCQHL